MTPKSHRRPSRRTAGDVVLAVGLAALVLAAAAAAVARATSLRLGWALACALFVLSATLLVWSLGYRTGRAETR